ncbi:DUF3396 domain-containing protein [Iodobacter sp. HSC-16F04]|uniref:DUF3396 domain-containing protein n=1 Tax=Iodobacter violaceini TaxID=3044271 RepID=A0ABX0KXC7_9NEIS|nr:type VI immunity family protein [Iodobacter violacea]NHQ86764.1 DUF3396 domain-containing protein [Iodobacter violacea]
MSFFEEWEEANWHFTYVDEDEPNKTTLQGGLVAVFYMVGAYLPARRQAIAQVMQEFHLHYGQHIQWGYWGDGQDRIRAYSASDYANSSEWVRTLPMTHPLEFTWSSGAGYEFVGSYAIEAYSMAGWKEKNYKGISYLNIYLPIEELQGNGLIVFERRLREWASLLQPLHGYAGLGFQQCNEYHRYENLELEHAEQFRCFDVGSCLSHDELREGFKSINWYTILSDDYLPKLGGKDVLASALEQEGLGLLNYSGGIMVKTGEYPELGWIEKGPLPASYIAANRILKPARVAELSNLHYGSIAGEARFTPDLTDQWLKRFDIPDEPVAYAVVVPFPQNNTDIQRCEAHQPCPQSGYWYTPAKQNSRALFKQGELMPDFPDSSYGATIWYWDFNQN